MTKELGEGDLEVTPENLKKVFAHTADSFLGLVRQALDMQTLPDYKDLVARQFETYVTQHNYNADQTEAQEWTEQVFIVRSERYRQAIQKGLDGRLQRATDKLRTLTPPPGRGKRQIQEETELTKAADAILKAHTVTGLLTYTFERQEKRQTKYLGRGCGNAERPTHEVVTVRCQITAVIRQEEAITALQKTFGWRAYVTNAPAEQLTLEQAVLTYRDE
ncbi:MAG: hypothetical protein Q8L87_15110, partial [Anaerolineales bacterium]|nr:hypothetical protein [Anaerolineales bacterium]